MPRAAWAFANRLATGEPGADSSRSVGEPGLPDLPGIFRELMAELRGALADRAPRVTAAQW
jgi:hypothetical protein